MYNVSRASSWFTSMSHSISWTLTSCVLSPLQVSRMSPGLVSGDARGRKRRRPPHLMTEEGLRRQRKENSLSK